MTSVDRAIQIDQIISSRRTEKMVGSDDYDWTLTAEELAAADSGVEASIRVAGWAPFHYPRNLDGLVEPWRVRWLKRAECLTMATSLHDWVPGLKPNHKFPGLLRACGSCVVVTWLPESLEGENPKRQQMNEEHLAATGAYVQNLLLALNARGLGSYWASGNVLYEGATPERLGLGSHERVAAVVFVNYRPTESEGSLEAIAGKLRDRRDPEFGWLRQVKL